jgi:hydroxymethylpyrimidine pyrophosphatase-like HAD family hydrolase
MLHRVTIPADIYHSLIGTCLHHGLSPLVYTCRGRLDLFPVERVYAQSGLPNYPQREFNGMDIDWVDNLLNLNTSDVTAVLVCNRDGACNIPSILGGFEAELSLTTSGGRYIEVAHRSATKLRALSALASWQKVRLTEFLAIGDSFNDLEMIKNVGFGVAVANAPLDVKAAANYVCRLESSSGVVEALRVLLSAVRVRRIEGRAAD